MISFVFIICDAVGTGDVLCTCCPELCEHEVVCATLFVKFKWSENHAQSAQMSTVLVTFWSASSEKRIEGEKRKVVISHC